MKSIIILRTDIKWLCLSFKGSIPVLVFFTGITRFDLLGDFGRFNWLGNFYIVLSYNLLFAVVTTLCLIRKFTSAVREELLKALGKIYIGKYVFLAVSHICHNGLGSVF